MGRTTQILALSALTFGTITIAWYISSRYGSRKKELDYDQTLKSSPQNSISSATNVEMASATRSRGNKFYNAGKYLEAIQIYSDSISLYPQLHPELALAYSNRAACHLALVRFFTAANFVERYGACY